MLHPSVKSFALVTFGIFLLIDTIACSNVTQVKFDRATHLASIMERTSIIFALTGLSKEDAVGVAETDSEGDVECHKHLQHLRSSILKRELWALKVLDASGRPPPGFIFGENFWLGSRVGCKAAHQVIDMGINRHLKHKFSNNIVTEISPFPVDYRIVYLLHRSPMQVDSEIGQQSPPIHLGLCVPASCSLPQLTRLMTAYVESDLYLDSDLFETKPSVLLARDLQLSADFYRRPLFVLVCAVGIFTAALTLAAFKLRRPVEGAPAQQGLREFINCYDVQRNWNKLFILPGNATITFGPLNAVRFISAFMSTYFHFYILLDNVTSNATELQIILNDMGSMDVAVDIYFSISGFLQAYNFMRDGKKMQQIRQNTLLANIKELFSNVMHRVLRLAPLYLMVAAISDLWFSYLSEVSVFRCTHRLHQMCVQNGWYNLLFLHNFVHLPNACQVWTWSLALDLQYSTLIAVILLLYAKHPKIAKAIVVLIVFSCIVYTYQTGVALKFQLTLDSTFAFYNELYTHPMARVLPYVLGVTTGWYYIECNSERIKSTLLAEALSYFMIFNVLFFIQAAPFGRGRAVEIDTLLLLVQRFMFSVGICCGIVSLANGRVAWLNRFLNWKGFQKGFQLSYAMSLINQPLIYILFSFNNRSVHIEPIIHIVSYFGFMMVLLPICGLCSLFFEMPYRNLLSVIQKRERQKMS